MTTGQQCSFYYNNWLSRDDPPYKTEVELFATDGEEHQLCRWESECAGVRGQKGG